MQRDVGQTIQAALDAVSKTWVALATVLVTVGLALAVLAAVALGSGSVVLYVLFTLVGYYLFAVGYVAAFKVIAEHFQGRSANGIAAIGESFGPAVSVLIAAVLVGLVVFIPLVILSIIPILGQLATLVIQIALGVYLIALVPAIVVEGRGPIDGIQRSYSLVAPRFWDVLVRLLVLFALGFVAAIVIVVVLLIGIGVTDEPSAVAVVFAAVLLALIYAVLMAFGAAFTTVIYFDLAASPGDAVAAMAYPQPGAPAAPGAPAPPPTSVAPPGAAWSAPAQGAPAAPPVPPPAAPPIPPPPAAAPPAAPPPVPPPAAPPAAPPVPPPAASPTDPGTGSSASTGSLWSSGDPLAPPPADTAPPWEPPSAPGGAADPAPEGEQPPPGQA